MYNTKARGYTSKNVLQELEDREFGVGRKVGLI